MKKFTFLFALLAFLSINVLGQSVTTDPAMNNETATPAVTVNTGEDVVITINNPKPNVEHALLIPGAPPTIIEKITSNVKGESFSFKPIKCNKKGTTNYSIGTSDLSISTNFNVVVGSVPRK